MSVYESIKKGLEQAIESEKPMLMQLAEPEYMCPKCGYKFYVYDENKRPDKCEDCGLVFDWYRNAVHYFMDETGTTQVGVCDDIPKEEFERIVDKFNSIPEVYPIFYDELIIAINKAEEDEAQIEFIGGGESDV